MDGANAFAETFASHNQTVRDMQIGVIDLKSIDAWCTVIEHSSTLQRLVLIGNNGNCLL